MTERALKPADFEQIFLNAFPAAWQVHTAPPLTARQRREQEFAALDIQNGDVLTLSNPGSVLTGPVEQVREQNGEWQVRIKGFGETPHGNHNTWFALGNYQMVNVAERAYRITPEDKLIAAIAGYTPEEWSKFGETNREYLRKGYKRRVEMVKKALD